MEAGLNQLRILLKSLTIYRHILQDRVFRAYVGLLDALGENSDPEAILPRYAEFTGLLAAQAEMGTGSIIGDAWSNHLLELVLEDENIFTRKAEYVSCQDLSPGLTELARHDLRVLQQASKLNTQKLWEIIAPGQGDQVGAISIPVITGDLAFYPFPKNSLCPAEEEDPDAEIKQALFSASDWGQCLELLAGYVKRHGCGIFRRSPAFRWTSGKGLTGIAHPDPVRLSDLISYERQREEVVENTRRFVRGLPANNVLLYGDRGTGKSSTVKALVHEFGWSGLRLVEVGRVGFADFPEILAVLRTRPQRFIVFIDDLSFEEYETEYKDLKAVMEGGLQPQPENVLIYATSNRKHLIKETLKDRSGAGVTTEGEIHPGDTLEEKISLADRFGIVVTFLRPDQKTYLKIVEGLADKEGITLGREELHSLALKWEMLHNGRSGRTARQFIQDLLGRTT